MKETSQTDVRKDQETMKPFPKSGGNNLFLVVGAFIVVCVGVLTGWFLSEGKRGTSAGTTKTSSQTSPNQQSAGSVDTTSMKDQAEGTLVEGGIQGEGTYHLERPGGASQNVYLTSTVIDLGSFVGKKVKVWGQTLSALHAGWLMDVGKVEVEK